VLHYWFEIEMYTLIHWNRWSYSDAKKM